VLPPRWNLVSLSMPFVGFGVGFAVGAMGNGILWDGHPMEGLFWGVLTWGTFCLLGLVAGGLAWRRGERYWGITLAGLLLSGLPVAVLLLSALQQLMNFLRYGW
jgi:hypothetical protein